MPFKQIFKVSRKTFFNPSAWIDANSLKNSIDTIWTVLKTITTPDVAAREEEYKGALKRLGITDKEAQERSKIYLVYAYFLAVLGLLCLVFSFYLLFKHTVYGWVIGVAASALFFGQAFRFHFWHFQIKHRRLGCTIKEWRQGKIHERESHD